MISEAAALLRSGETVAFPTETVYGLGADARNTTAVEAVFAAKGRPSDNPLIVHIARREDLERLVTEVHPVASALIDAFWPGPLTLVLPVRPGVLSPLVTAGLDTVGVRMPDHPVALALLRAADCPVAAPSANRSGRPSPTLASHVLEDLAGYIGGVLDGGAAGVGLESTVVQVQPDGTAAVLRPGGITAEQLAAVTGTEAAAAKPAAGANTPAGASGGGSVPVPPAAEPGVGEAGSSPAPRAPGMKYTHYARAARLASYAAPPRSAWRRPPQGCCRRRSGRARSRACSSSRSIGPCIPPTRPPARCLSARCPRRRRLPASCMPLCGVLMKRGPRTFWPRPARSRASAQPL